MEFKNTEESKHEEQGITYYQRENVTVDGTEYERLAIQTHFIERGEPYIELIGQYVLPLVQPGSKNILSIGEKVISMCQNNVVDKKDVKVGFFARVLSKFATSNNHGIAMDEPYKLQLAINLAGLPRILLACVCSAITKLFGIRGVFYKIAGNDIGGIDGFYMDSAFEIYQNIAVLNPRDPAKVCDEIYENFSIPCMIVDANDLSIEILGTSACFADTDHDYLKSLIWDNPAGQSCELTPFILMRSCE